MTICQRVEQFLFNSLYVHQKRLLKEKKIIKGINKAPLRVHCQGMMFCPSHGPRHCLSGPVRTLIISKGSPSIYCDCDLTIKQYLN